MLTIRGLMTVSDGGLKTFVHDFWVILCNFKGSGNLVRFLFSLFFAVPLT